MSKATRADWAASAPWSGIQGRPLYLRDTGIPVSAIIGLNLPGNGVTLAQVAYSGKYSDLVGRPSFGSAAFVDSGYFSVAGAMYDIQSSKYQSGSEPLVAATQSYTIVFPEEMDDVPLIDLQLFITAGTDEKFYLSVEDTVTTTGFTFWLNSIPVAPAGRVQWRARTP